MIDIYLPTLHWFAMQNPFSGSCGDLRYFIRPNVVKAGSKEVDFAQSKIVVELWHGMYCYEMSQIEERAEFPMSEDGLNALRSWLVANV
jgi:hypothetical protein